MSLAPLSMPEKSALGQPKVGDWIIFRMLHWWMLTGCKVLNSYATREASVSAARHSVDTETILELSR